MDLNKLTKITSKSMQSSMGSEEILKTELYNLLKSWMMEDLTDYFMEQQLYVSILKQLTPEMAIRIFDNNEVSLGVQIIFLKKWNDWKNIQCNGSPSKSKESTIEVINLNQVLNSNPYGLTVKQTFEKEKKLNENTRKLLLEAILHYCIDNNHSLTVKDSENLGNQIVNVFPNEELAYYFEYRPNAAPLGKIYQKYRNWKCNLARKSKNVTKDDTDVSSVEISDEESLRILKHEFKNIPFEQIMNHWLKCINIRIKSLNDVKKSSSMDLLLKEWPMYIDPLGYKLIDEDFKFIYGEKNDLLDNSLSFIEMFIEKVLPQYIAKLKDDDKILAKYLTNNKSNSDKNSVFLILLFIIQSILPLSRIQNSALRKGNARFYSRNESRHAFIKMYDTVAEYKEISEKRVKSKIGELPRISVIGSIYDPQEIFFDCSTINYTFFSLSKAIDISFKAYNIFNIKFPEECLSIWDFINLQFYKLEKDNVVATGVKLLIKCIKECEETTVMEVID